MEERGSSYSGSSGGFFTRRPIWGWLGTGIFFIAFFFIFTSYVAPDWIQVNLQRAPRDTTFRKLGLWMSCFTNLHDPYYYDPYLTSGYEGCRWIYYPVVSTYLDLRDFLLPSFIIPVQITYTLCFITCMALFFMILVYLIRYDVSKVGTLPYLIVIGMMLQGAGLLGTVSVIVFGALSGSRTWAHEWQFNDLSWAFGVAVAGVVLLHLAGVFFLIEAYFQYKRRRRMAEGTVVYPVGGFAKELKRKFGKKEKVPEKEGPTGPSRPKEIMTRLGNIVSGLPTRVRESFSMAMGEPQKSQYPKGAETYFRPDMHPSGLLPGSGSPSDEGSYRERNIPIQHPDERVASSSEESLTLPREIPPPPPKPRPRTPPPSEEGIPSEALERMLWKAEPMPERPDSGIGLASPIPPSPPKQLITSSLKGKFLGKPEPPKKPKKPTKPSMPSYAMKVSPPASSPDSEVIDLEEPPRVRRPSGNGASASQRRRVHPQDSLKLQRSQLQSISIESLQRDVRPPPLPRTPPPTKPKEETLLAIKPIFGRPSPTSLTLRTSEIPPPPTWEEEATLPYEHRPRSRAPLSIPSPETGRQPSPSPTRLSHLLEREPGITSYQDFIYTSSQITEETQQTTTTRSRAPQRPAESEYGLPSPEEYFAARSPERKTPTPSVSKPSPEPVKEPPKTAAEAVAEILASRQPLSLRIHIQKHKTEKSYKKSQSTGKGNNGNGNGNGDGNIGSDHSESSM